MSPRQPEASNTRVEMRAMSQMVANVASITKHWTIEGYLEAGAKTPVYYRISGMAKVTTETKGVKTEEKRKGKETIVAKANEPADEVTVTSSQSHSEGLRH